jgi:coenzyme F420-dependent glucose-6-phosphate dehydrogenase
MANRLRLGYKLSSEEFGGNDLVRFATAAESHGFEFALISDHFHPWSDREGQSPFVWSVLGAIANATTRLEVGTAVTCPTVRIHPAIIAQASATVASMMPGRFFLGVGTGENLNEHITGHRWAQIDIRQEMLAEAIEVIRLLWMGGLQNHHGKYYTVENARLYSRPEQSPALYVAAAGPKSTRLAVTHGDGLIGTEANAKMIQQFRRSAGDKPCYGEVQVCYGPDENEAVKLVKDVWPIASLPGPLQRELPLPSHFEAVGKLVSEQQISEAVPCGPDPEKHLKMIRQYIDAGYDHVCIHQIGPAQEQFMQFYQSEILPKLKPDYESGRQAA